MAEEQKNLLIQAKSKYLQEIHDEESGKFEFVCQFNLIFSGFPEVIPRNVCTRYPRNSIKFCLLNYDTREYSLAFLDRSKGIFFGPMGCFHLPGK